MSALHFEIGRLNLQVAGVSSEVVEEALAGLGDELRRRVGGAALALGSGANIPELNLGSVELAAPADAAALRHQLADRLTLALTGALKGGG